MRLGDGYVEALRRTMPEVPESADFVMYWWDQAAELIASAASARVSASSPRTASVRRFNRRFRTPSRCETSLSSVFAIPDHPWVDAADGAAVRIAMTVGEAGLIGPAAVDVVEEPESTDQSILDVVERVAELLHRILRWSRRFDASGSRGQRRFCCPGVKLHGQGLLFPPRSADPGSGKRCTGPRAHSAVHDRPRSATGPRGFFVIDLFGLRTRCPRTLPGRLPVAVRARQAREDLMPQTDGVQYAKLWWLFGEPRPAHSGERLPASRAILRPSRPRSTGSSFPPMRQCCRNMLVVIAR